MDEDIEKLEKFILDVKDDINSVVSQIVDLNPGLEIFYSLLRKAWDDVRPSFNEVQKYLKENKYKNEIWPQLKSRGLTGVQLELKLKVYYLYRNEFFKAKENKEKRGIIGKIIGKLFRIIDRIFESLGFIPAIDGIKEFKGILEEIIP